jgi:hypothetical protein
MNESASLRGRRIAPAAATLPPPEVTPHARAEGFPEPTTVVPSVAPPGHPLEQNRATTDDATNPVVPSTVRGVARSVNLRTIATPNGGSMTRLTSRVDRYDRGANRLQPVGVEMRQYRQGQLTEATRSRSPAQASMGRSGHGALSNSPPALTSPPQVESFSSSSRRSSSAHCLRGRDRPASVRPRLNGSRVPAIPDTPPAAGRSESRLVGNAV